MHFLGNIRRLLISIHALLAESDLSCRQRQVIACISIHALLAESDFDRGVTLPPHKQFLSTLSLRRATRERKDMIAKLNAFLSTLSLRRATAQHFSTLHNIFISIHALLAESDYGLGWEV